MADRFCYLWFLRTTIHFRW